MTQKQKARQERAAQRLQSAKATAIPAHWDEAAIEMHLNLKLQEFEAHCRNQVISHTNVYPAALNVLAGAADRLGSAEHQRWLGIFNQVGKNAGTRTLGDA